MRRRRHVLTECRAAVGFRSSIAAIALLAWPWAVAAGDRLDSDITYLDTKSGIRLLQDAESLAPYALLTRHHVVQETPTYCGVASAAASLNLLNVPRPTSERRAKYPYFDQKNTLMNDGKAVLPLEKVGQSGMTLAELAKLLRAHGAEVTEYYAEKSSVDQFVKIAAAALHATDPADVDEVILVNYHRNSLGQSGSGHISPLAARESRSGKLLILDVAGYRYAPCWVPSELLFQAMNTIDDESEKSRGFLRVRKSP